MIPTWLTTFETLHGDLRREDIIGNSEKTE